MESSFMNSLIEMHTKVGHIPQVNGTQHLASSLGQYLKNVISGENWHDGRYSTKEHDADKGAQEFQKFNKFIDNLKSATKPLKVLIAFTRPLITEFADNLNLKHPLLPTISPYPTM